MASSPKKSSTYQKYNTRTRKPDPKTAALLVIDAQNYFSSMVKPILPNLLATIRLCRRASIPVVFTRQCHKSLTDNPVLAEWWNGHLILDGTPDAEIMPDIDAVRLPGEDVLMEKNTYSAFQGTDLEEILRKRGVEEVIVAGVMTNLCCETTARDAFVRGFRVFFSEDATATENAELHDAALTNLAFGFAYLVNCETLKEGLFGN